MCSHGAKDDWHSRPEDTLEQLQPGSKSGNVVVIAERGQPVARLVPIRPTVEQRLDELIEARLLEWSGQHLSPSMPEIETRGGMTLADLLLEDRE